MHVLIAWGITAWLATMVFAYGAGARAAYWKGLAFGQHLAGREMMRVLAAEADGDDLPPASMDDLRAPKTWGPN